MASSKQFKLDLQYAKAMEDHPYGVAMYRPPKLSILRAGMVGYFDDFGSWNVLVDLQSEEDLSRNGLTPVDGLVKAPTDNGIRWGPITSTKTKSTKLDLSGGVAPAPGIPVTASAVYSYSVDKDVGAILLTSQPIVHDRFYHTSPFKNWMKANALNVLKRWPDEVKENSIWIVTSTYSTEKCAINMWQKRGKKFKVGFSADVVAVGSVGPSTEWYRSTSDEGWGEYTSEGDDRPVVFFGGFKFNYSQWFRPRKSLVLDQSAPAGRNFRTGGPGEKGEGDTGEKETSEAEGEEEEEEMAVIVSIPDPEHDEYEFQVDCEEYLGETEQGAESEQGEESR